MGSLSCPTTSECEAAGDTSVASPITGEQQNVPFLVGTTDGGATWTLQTLPADLGSIDSVSCAGPLACEADGSTASGTSVTLGTVDGGAQWTQQALPTDVTAVNDLATAGSTFVAVGSGSSPTGGVVLTDALPAPTTTVGLPAAGSTLTGGVWLDASATSPDGVAGVHYVLSGGPLAAPETIATATLTVDGWVARWNATSTAPGSYTLTATATDTNGHTATSAGITVTVGSAPVAT